MITVLNDVVVSEIRAEMGRQELSQLEVANRIGWRPEYLGRRLTRHVPLSVTDVEQIGEALGVAFLQSPRGLRRAS